MDSFGVLGGLFGCMISSGKFEIQTAIVTSQSPFNSAKDIVIVLGHNQTSHISSISGTPGYGGNGPGGSMAEGTHISSTQAYVYFSDWMVPGQTFKTISEIKSISTHTIETASSSPVGLIIITKA